MLLWQHKKHKVHYWYHLIGCVLFTHLLLCFFLLYVSNNGPDQWYIDTQQCYDANIVIVPFKKTEPTPTPDAKPQAQPITKPKRTTLAQAKPKSALRKKQPQKKAKPKPQLNRKKQPENIQANEQAKKSKAKVDLQEKKDAPTPVSPKKTATKAPEQRRTQSAKKRVSTQQAQALSTQQALAQEIEKQWHPPAGFGQDIAVTLGITLNYQGGISAIETEHSSGVPAFDIHARSAVYAMCFPRACWGKKIVITFN